jgi:predicted HNH restriction endonuclease
MADFDKKVVLEKILEEAIQTVCLCSNCHGEYHGAY